MNLSDMKSSITSLPFFGATRLLEPIRVSRQVSKAPRTKAIAKKRESKKDKISNLKNLTPAQAAILLERLKAMENIPDNVKRLLGENKETRENKDG